MTPKLSTGEFLHTVKMYIFITNEYGKPTEGSIDLFIESFGALLLNKDFAIYDRVKNELDAWWSKVEQDLQDRQLQSLIKYTGGFEWFKQLTMESKALTKEQEEQFKNDRNSFKEWIYNIEIVEETMIEEKQKYNYKLISSDFIGNELQITESVDDISSSYKANIVDEVNIRLADTDLIVNINKFIEEVENRNVTLKIKMGFFGFDFLYKEEK